MKTKLKERKFDLVINRLKESRVRAKTFEVRLFELGKEIGMYAMRDLIPHKGIISQHIFHTQPTLENPNPPTKEVRITGR